MADKKFDVKSALEALTKEKWDDNESQGRAVAILRGLAFSDDKEANDFMHDLHTAALALTKKFLKENFGDKGTVKTESVDEGIDKVNSILEGVDEHATPRKDKDIDLINSIL